MLGVTEVNSEMTSAGSEPIKPRELDLKVLKRGEAYPNHWAITPDANDSLDRIKKPLRKLDTALYELRRWNQGNIPPLDDAESQRTEESAVNYPSMAKRWREI